MTGYHIGSKGTSVVFKAGYVNRTNRRKLAKKDPDLLKKMLLMSGQIKEQ